MNYMIYFAGVITGLALMVLFLKAVGVVDDYKYYREKQKHGWLRALHLATKNAF